MLLNLPIWIYWEGHEPEWIKLCKQTIFFHASNVHSLSPKSFDELRDRDRDIDLSKLCTAHRADFIRSFLLARYGGVWLDSDCLVMKHLDPWISALELYDFFGYKERGEPYITNSFIGARPGSLIATEFYRRNCAILRSNANLGWTTIGATSLTETISNLKLPWLQLGYDLIQPICWSRPELFFIRRTESDHEIEFNRRSICYMLSNTALQTFIQANPNQLLLQENTFFSFLYRKAMNVNESINQKQISSQFSSLNHIPFCAKLLKEIAPNSVIDTSIDFGRWGILVRDICDHSSGHIHRENWHVWVEGIAASTTDIEEYHDHFYNYIHTGDAVLLLSRLPRRFELGFVTSINTLATTIEVCDYVIALITNNRSYLELPIRPLREQTFDDVIGNYEIFLFSKKDPKCIGRVNSKES